MNRSKTGTAYDLTGPPGAPVLVHTGLVAAGTNGVIHFNAPEAAGRYPYLCTFPGHWRLMQGELVVE